MTIRCSSHPVGGSKRRSPLRVIAGAVLSLSALASCGPRVEAQQEHPAMLLSEFIYTEAPFPECHASTLAETQDGIVAAWFGGTREKHPDVGIWVARRTDSGWTQPVEVANGVQDDGSREPCWNPVLFQVPQGKLLLFFKVGPSPSSWWGEMISSSDGGKTWGERRRLPADIAGPIENKPVLTADGALLCGSSTEDHGWRVHVERTPDQGATWTRTEALNDGVQVGAIQPTLLRLGPTSWRMLCRSRRGGKVLSAVSSDDGQSWSELKPLDAPNPNSGIDAATLADGRHVLIYNNTPRGRTPLNVGLSTNSVDWRSVLVLEDEAGEYSYPAVIQAADGKVHLTYTWKRRRIKYVVLDPMLLN